MTATPYNRALHWFARFLALATFVLLLAGGLVTSNDAGLAVPDWPTSFGSLYRIPPMVGGVLFEHGHRMIAQFVGFLTIILAVWLQRTDRRPFMRKLGWTALGLVIVQGIFGGITVKMMTPPPVSSIHATLAQTFFWLTMLLALFTSRSWLEPSPAAEPERRSPAVSLRALSLLLVAALYLQLVTGAAFRHVWTKLGPSGKAALDSSDIIATWLTPHLLNIVLVVSLLLWTCITVLREFGHIRPLRRSAVTLLALLQAQMLLGFASYLSRVEWGRNAIQPLPLMVWSTVFHLGVGALMLATAVILAVQMRRYVAAGVVEKVPSGGRSAVTA